MRHHVFILNIILTSKLLKQMVNADSVHNEKKLIYPYIPMVSLVFVNAIRMNRN